MRHIVVDASRVVESKGPQCGVEFVWPVKSQVKEHGSSHALHATNGGFGCAVLVMRADSREGCLLSCFERVLIGLSSEDTIVCMVLLYLETVQSTFALECLLSQNRFVRQKGGLVMHEDLARSMVVEKGTTTAAKLCSLLSSSFESTTTDR